MDNTNIKTLKLNVSTIKSPLSGGGSSLGRVGQEGTSKVGTLAKIVRKNRIAINSLVKSQESQKETSNSFIKSQKGQDEKITRIKNILQTKKQNVGKKLPTENINNSLAETNKILIAIQNQLALQSQNDRREEKEERRRESTAESKRKLKREESALEKTAKGIGKAVGKLALKIVQPIGGIFDKILEFVTLLGAGIATNAAFGWFKDEENRKKLTKFFNILKENWTTIALIAGALTGGILIAKIIGFVFALKGLSAFLLNPLTLTAIGLLAATVFAMTAKTTSENLASIVGDDDNKRRQMIKGFEQMREMDDEKLKQVSGQEPRGFRAELNKQIYFLKTGRPLLYDRGKKGLFPPSYRKMADSATFREKMAFSEFVDKGARVQGMLEGPAVVQPIEQRERGGPVTAGQPYLVGEGGPEIFSPNINGSIVNNMRTEKIVQTLSSDIGGGINMIEFPPITNQLPPPEIPVPSGPATEVPEVSSVNLADPYRQLTPMLYGITV